MWMEVSFRFLNRKCGAGYGVRFLPEVEFLKQKREENHIGGAEAGVGERSSLALVQKQTQRPEYLRGFARSKIEAGLNCVERPNHRTDCLVELRLQVQYR